MATTDATHDDRTDDDHRAVPDFAGFGLGEPPLRCDGCEVALSRRALLVVKWSEDRGRYYLQWAYCRACGADRDRADTRCAVLDAWLDVEPVDGRPSDRLVVRSASLSREVDHRAPELLPARE